MIWFTVGNNAIMQNKEDKSSMDKKSKKGIKVLVETLTDVMTRVEEHRDLAQDKYDASSESYQMSEKGDALEEVIYVLEEAMMSIEEAISQLNSIIE